MKLSCMLGLVLYAAFVFGYYQWLGQTFESKELWIASFIAGLVAVGGVGALCNSYLAWRDASVLSDAIVDMPRRDGKRTAVSGTLEPLGQPLTAPLSGKSCVLYEYDISREVTRSKQGGGTETSKSIDFAGLGKAECIIRSTSSKLRLLGFPDLDPIADEYLEEQADVERARQYVQFTTWEDVSGLGIFHGARDMFSALTGSEESLRKDWRMIAVKDCAWLKAEAVSPAEEFPAVDDNPATEGFVADEKDVEGPIQDKVEDEEFDDDEDDVGATWQDGSGYHPHLSEKRIEPGQQVVVIGRYDEVRQGLVSGGTQTIKIYLEDLQSVARKLASAKWGYLFGGILTLVIVNVGVWGAQQLYRNSDDTQRKWRNTLEQAVRDGDVQGIEKILQRELDLNAVRRPGEMPLLLEAKDPAIAKLLIERGADVNATDSDGQTALMAAAHAGNSPMLQMLIDAGADLDRKHQKFHTTALMVAIDAEKPECIEILRRAGAKDDTVTAENGKPITEEHEAFNVCSQYLSAVFSQDTQKLKELSTPERRPLMDGIDWDAWQESRPKEPRLVSGFFRGDDATVIVTGLAPIGADRTWFYQLRRLDGQWRVARESWITEGLR